jgi:hypothetical protein
MPRSMVGLLAAVGAAMSALVGLTHGDLPWGMVVGGATAVGLAAYQAFPAKKKCLHRHRITNTRLRCISALRCQRSVPSFR